MIIVGRHIKNLRKSKSFDDRPNSSFHKLLRVGDKAVGPLLKAFNDINATRAAFNTDTGRYTLRVCDLALQVIAKYFEKFRETTSSEFRFQPNANEKDRKKVSAKWMDWWKKNNKDILWNRRTYQYEYKE